MEWSEKDVIVHSPLWNCANLPADNADVKTSNIHLFQETDIESSISNTHKGTITYNVLHFGYSFEQSKLQICLNQVRIVQFHIIQITQRNYE